jgi:hypothetical protein
MLHFSFDDLDKRPEVCRMLLQLAIGPYLLRNPTLRSALLAEKEVLRLAWNLGRPVRPKDVSDRLEVDFRTARKWLRSLVEKGWLHPNETCGGVRSYGLTQGSLSPLL